MKSYYVHMLANKPRGTLYIGVTNNNLQRRVIEQKRTAIDGFTKKYVVKIWTDLSELGGSPIEPGMTP